MTSKSFVSKSDLIFVFWLCFQGVIGIRNVKKSFSAVNWRFNIQVINRYEILLDSIESFGNALNEKANTSRNNKISSLLILGGFQSD